ncbi:MAG: hypothetical protein JZU63_00100, partial [Rhodoferax sp.]|nr:hypothetical protein [Rhodoferax sp.]
MAVIVGLGVSVFMLMTVTDLRKHLARERARVMALADAAIKLAVEAKKEDSMAYQLAVHFIALRKDRADAVAEAAALAVEKIAAAEKVASAAVLAAKEVANAAILAAEKVSRAADAVAAAAVTAAEAKEI